VEEEEFKLDSVLLRSGNESYRPVNKGFFNVSAERSHHFGKSPCEEQVSSSFEAALVHVHLCFLVFVSLAFTKNGG
jgi:hypothetical protein